MKTFLFFFSFTLSLYASFLYGKDPDYKLVILNQAEKKSKKNYIKYILHQCFDEFQIKKLENIDIIKFKQCLMDSRKFSSLKVQIKKKTIILDFKERWSIIPVPYIAKDKFSTAYGLFVIDSHFLGLGKTVIGGFYTSNRGQGLILMYYDWNFLYSDFVLEWKSKYTNRSSYALLENQSLFGYEERLLKEDFSFGYKLSTYSSLHILSEWYSKKYQSKLNLPHLNDHKSFLLGLEFSYRNTDYHFYFDEGLSFNLSFKEFAYRNSNLPKTTKYRFSFFYQRELWIKHALDIAFKIHHNNSSLAQDAMQLGQTRGSRGIPSKGLWVKSYGSFSLDYKIPFISTNYGTWVTAPFFDYISFSHIQTSFPFRNDFSYGLGLYLYLKKISIPGLGLLFGKDKNFQNSFISFTLGRAL